jgi:hypothetical protein
MVTIAFCALAAGDEEMAKVQRLAYREFRDNVTAQLRLCGVAEAAARGEAERLIAIVDGVAVQAIFDPRSWPAPRQRAMLDEAMSTVPTVAQA